MPEGERLIAWRKSETSPEALLAAARSLANVLTNIADVLDANERTSEAQAHRREAAALLDGTAVGPYAAEPDPTPQHEV